MPADPFIAWVVDVAIVVTVCECVLLVAFGWRHRRPDVGRQVWNVVAGLFLMVAMRAVIAASSGFVVASCLAAAGAAHAIDLRARLRNVRPPA